VLSTALIVDMSPKRQINMAMRCRAQNAYRMSNHGACEAISAVRRSTAARLTSVRYRTFSWPF